MTNVEGPFGGKKPESTDFWEPVSLAYKEHLGERRKEPRSLIWFFVGSTAVLTSAFTIFMVSVLHQMQKLKYFLLHEGLLGFSRLDDLSETTNRDYVMGYVMWVSTSVVCAICASMIGRFVPYTVGGGTPEVLAMLNGVHTPSLFSLRALFAKIFATLFSVASGLPIGYYGPIVSAGAMCAAALLQRGKLWRFKFLTYFRNPRDQRIIMIVGAAVGVTGAFGVPLGGLMFVMEMLATAFPLRLAFYVFTSCLTCSFFIQVFFSYFRSFQLRDRSMRALGELLPGAMVQFDTRIQGTKQVPMNFFSFIPALILGVLCGLLGAAYIKLCTKVVQARAHAVHKWKIPLLRGIESSIQAAAYATLVYWLAVSAFGTEIQNSSRVLSLGCNQVPQEFVMQYGQSTVNFYGIQSDICKIPPQTGTLAPNVTAPSYFQPFASLTFGFADSSAQMLLAWHSHRDFGLVTAFVFLVIYFVFSVLTAGARITGDILLPAIVIGASIGRLVGVGTRYAAIAAASGDETEVTWADPGAFALIGAGAFLAGTTRLTFSIAVILIELTNDFRHVGCVMVAISVAKAVGDRLTKSSASTFLDLNEVPVLDFYDEIGRLDSYCAKDVMTRRVKSLETVETIARLCHFLHKTTHNGFPVVSVDGTVKGLILKSQLRLLLWRIFLKKDNTEATYNDLRDTEHTVHDLNIATQLPTFGPEWAEVRINLNNHIDTSCFCIHEAASLSRMYALFQTLGVRHLVVVSADNKLSGIITRKDLTRVKIQQRLVDSLENAPPSDKDAPSEPDSFSFPKSPGVPSGVRSGTFYASQEAILGSYRTGNLTMDDLLEAASHTHGQAHQLCPGAIPQEDFSLVREGRRKPMLRAPTAESTQNFISSVSAPTKSPTQQQSPALERILNFNQIEASSDDGRSEG